MEIELLDKRILGFIAAEFLLLVSTIHLKKDKN
jgi:hypothetical protein